MTDKELLELAAKAAGVVFQLDDDDQPIQYPDGGFQLGWRTVKWNPLTDDGDRYRLAKKLDIRLHFGPAYVTYVAGTTCGVIRWPEDAKDDAYAVVQAAAAIGAAK